MKVTKIGHCCLLLELKGIRILTDPGTYTIEKHEKLRKINYIFITHEHADHYHLDSLKVVMQKNPEALIYTNNSVSRLLTREGIYHHLVKNGETVLLDDGKISVLGVGMNHAVMHKSIPQSENTGFFFDDKLFYSGDSLGHFTQSGSLAGNYANDTAGLRDNSDSHEFNQPVEILALPVSGPWLKISDAIDFALEIKPKFCFPVHDFGHSETSHRLPAKILPENGIEFVALEEGDSHVFD